MIERLVVWWMGRRIERRRQAYIAELRELMDICDAGFRNPRLSPAKRYEAFECAFLYEGLYREANGWV